MNELSNLIIPRVNINSENSIQDAINLAETFKFDSFILFSSDEVKFEKKKPFPLSRMADLKKELNKPHDELKPDFLGTNEKIAEVYLTGIENSILLFQI